jgi:hypothetical protein
MVLIDLVSMFLPASHAYKHPFVGSTLLDGVYELTSSTANGSPDKQTPQAEVPAAQDLSFAPAPEYIQDKHRCISRIFFKVLAPTVKYLCIRFIGVFWNHRYTFLGFLLSVIP